LPGQPAQQIFTTNADWVVFRYPSQDLALCNTCLVLVALRVQADEFAGCSVNLLVDGSQ